MEMENVFAGVVEKLKGLAADFNAKSDGRTVPGEIEAAVAAVRAKQSEDGVFVGSEAGIQQLTRQLQAKAETAALVAGTNLELGVAGARETFATARKSFENLKLPSKAYRGQDEGVRAMMRSADATETYTTYLGYQGRTLADVADAAERSTDEDVVFTVLVENGLADGWQSWPLTRTPRMPSPSCASSDSSRPAERRGCRRNWSRPKRRSPS